MNDAELERSVLESIRQVKARYERIKSLTDEISDSDPKNDFEQRLEKIQAERISIEKLQSDTRPLYDQYIGSREHASPEVRDVTDQVTKLIQHLIIKFSSLENSARSSQQKMLPVVNENLRALQMKSAYERRTA